MPSGKVPNDRGDPTLVPAYSHIYMYITYLSCYNDDCYPVTVIQSVIMRVSDAQVQADRAKAEPCAS